MISKQVKIVKTGLIPGQMRDHVTLVECVNSQRSIQALAQSANPAIEDSRESIDSTARDKEQVGTSLN